MAGTNPAMAKNEEWGVVVPEWRLKQAELLAGKHWRGEQVGAELDRFLIESKAFGGDFESASYHPGIGSLAHHALAPLGIVELAAAGRAHQRQYAVGRVRAVRLQPLGEQ